MDFSVLATGFTSKFAVRSDLKRQRILFNASTCVVGGGVQVATELIFQAKKCTRNPDIDWLFCVSHPVLEATKGRGICQSNLDVIAESPSRSREVRNQLGSIETAFQPHSVLTVFGPSYLRFKAPHLMGIADGWVTHSSRLAYSTLPSISLKIVKLLSCIYKGFWYRQANRWFVEAEVAKIGFARRFRVDQERIAVIPNCCASHYLEYSGSGVGDALGSQPREVRFLVFGAGYGHKNLQIIPKVAKSLKELRPELRFKFIVTLDEHDAFTQLCKQASSLGVIDCLENQGRIAVSDGPSLYQSVDLSFFPSVLETFSAVYPESMAMGRPIVTSDLDFAKSICGDAALYFNPMHPRAGANAILEILENTNVRKRLVENGRLRLRSFPNSEQRYLSIVSELRRIARNPEV